MGYTDDAYMLDTAGSGNSNSGHDYRTKLSENQRRGLIEYLNVVKDGHEETWNDPARPLSDCR